MEVFDVLLNGVADNEDVPWKDAQSALEEALSLKKAHPEVDVCVRIRIIL